MTSKLLIPFALIISLNILLVVFLNSVSERFNEAHSRIFESSEVVSLIHTTTKQLKDNLISDQQTDNTKFESDLALLQDKFEHLPDLYTDNILNRAELGKNIDIYLTALDNLMLQSEKPVQIGDESLLLFNSKLDDAIFSIEQQLKTANRDLLNEIQLNVNHSRQYGIIIVILVILFSFIALILSTILIIQPLRRLKTEIAKLSDGNRTLIKEERKDEIGDLIIAYNNAIETLIKSENNLILSNQKLNEANKELESFAYSVSHDLRSPLRSLSGFSEALVRNHSDQLNDEAKDYLGRVHRAAEKMGELIDEILKLSRLSKKEVVRSNVDLSKLSIETLNLILAEPEETLELKITESLTTTCDEGLAKIVLLNLISNAVKFSSLNEVQKIEIGTISRGGNNYFFVRDNGVGFNMKYVDKITGAFQRLHSKSEFEGTGIGLATVSRIINKHRGTLFFESEEGKGTTVYFNFG